MWEKEVGLARSKARASSMISKRCNKKKKKVIMIRKKKEKREKREKDVSVICRRGAGSLVHAVDRDISLTSRVIHLVLLDPCCQRRIKSTDHQARTAVSGQTCPERGHFNKKKKKYIYKSEKLKKTFTIISKTSRSWCPSTFFLSIHSNFFFFFFWMTFMTLTVFLHID